MQDNTSISFGDKGRGIVFNTDRDGLGKAGSARGDGKTPEQGGARFVVHVVEGAGDKNPGRIRTLRFDTNGGGQEWLHVEWIETPLPDGSSKRVGIEAANIAKRHRANGAFFLLNAYDDDPNPQKRERGREVFAEWFKRLEAGEAVGQFPDDWLPQVVLDLRKIAKDKTSAKWQPPKLEKVPSAKS